VGYMLPKCIAFFWRKKILTTKYNSVKAIHSKSAVKLFMFKSGSMKTNKFKGKIFFLFK
jgi:hypothetical protein